MNSIAATVSEAAPRAAWRGVLEIFKPRIALEIMLAGVAGVAIPLLLDRLDQDPAVASSIFVTMTTDSMGFLAFLGWGALQP